MEQIIYKKCAYLLTSSDGKKKLIYEFYKCAKDLNGNEQQENLSVLETNLIVKELVSCYRYELSGDNGELFSFVDIVYYDNNGNMITFKKEQKEKIQDFKNLKKQSNILDFLTYEQDQDFRLTNIVYNISGVSINIPVRVLCPKDTLFFDYNKALEIISKAKQNIKDKTKKNIEKHIVELTNNIVSKIVLGNDYSMEASFVYAMIFSGILENINKNGSINPNLRFLFYKSHNELYRDKDILPLLRRLQYNNNNGAEVVFQNNDQQNNDNNNILILAPNFEKLGHTSIYFKKIHNNDQQIFLFDTQSSEIRNIENIKTYYNNNFIYNIQTTYGGGSCTLIM